MSSLEQKLHTALVADPNLPSLCPQGFFDLQLPQGLLKPTSAVPMAAITVQRIGTQRMAAHSAPSGDTVGLTTALALIRIQFTAWTVGPDSNLAALTILESLRTFLNANSWAGGIGHSNRIVNERVVPFSQTIPPVYSGVMEALIYNREDL